MSGMRLAGDYREVEKHLDHLMELPTPESIMGLEFALAAAFADVTAHVHVITGALRGSGKTSSDVHGKEWHGQMTWGGPSPGFLPKPPPAHPRHEAHPGADERARNEVVYAFFEKRRGGAHDFLGDDHAYAESFRHAFLNGIRQ